MSVFSDIEKRHDKNIYTRYELGLLREFIVAGKKAIADRATLIAIIKAAKQEIQDMRDDYAPDVHPDHDFLENMEDILEGKS